MTVTFFLVITCMHPTATAILKNKNWAACQRELKRFKQQDDKDNECIAQCVGEGVYSEVWKKLLEKKKPLVSSNN